MTRRLAILAAALAVVAWWLRRPSADSGPDEAPRSLAAGLVMTPEAWARVQAIQSRTFAREDDDGIQVDVGLLR